MRKIFFPQLAKGPSRCASANLAVRAAGPGAPGKGERKSLCPNSFSLFGPGWKQAGSGGIAMYRSKIRLLLVSFLAGAALLAFSPRPLWAAGAQTFDPADYAALAESNSTVSVAP